MQRELNFDGGWLFHEGDIPRRESAFKGQMYTGAKTERAVDGPASMAYKPDVWGLNPDNWKQVTLPHDYIISQTPKKENNETLGYFSYPPAWYRKSFKLGPEDADKRLTLFFEGAATNAVVWVNGCLMLHNFCGYTSFEVDFTDVARFDAENTVAVYLTSDSHEGWWYQGAGLYRRVKLRITELVSIDMWGVFAKNKHISGEKWSTTVETELRNDSFDDKTAILSTELLDGDKNTIAKGEVSVDIDAKYKAAASQTFEVDTPSLWDTENPNFYYVKSTLTATDGEKLGETLTRYGYRDAIFDPDKGFFLNGRHCEIKGVCCHQDWGLSGKAVPENIQRYRLRLLREMGANGYRCSHYPQHEATMEAFDELGFLVMAETRWFESTDEGKAQLEMLIRRDRNHPSVIMWSLGNEEALFAKETGKRIMQSLYRYAKRLDDTRPVMCAVSNSPADAPVFDVADLIGINYNLTEFDKLHKKYSDKPILSSENCAVGSTRGWLYDDDGVRGYLNAKDVTMSGWQTSREKTWQFFKSREWIAGGYQWAGIEHRGETVWPRLCSQSGALDLFLQKKDAFYQNQSLWTDKPMIHLVGHWNLGGRDGEIISVWAYTNCDEAELILNGVSRGRKPAHEYEHLEWNVPYIAGKIEVIGYKDGAAAARDASETTGRPVKLSLSVQNSDDLHCGGGDAAVIKCVCLDALGREVPDASPEVSFTTSGNSSVIGTGSDVSDHTPVTSPDRRMRAGIITAAVKAPSAAGSVRVYASSAGLEDARCDIDFPAL